MRKLPRDISRQSGQPLGVAGQSTLHESAWLHVTGTARYIDDLPEPEGILHAAVGHSEQAHARVLSLDLSAVRAYPGVVAVLTVDDVPGHTDIGPVFPGLVTRGRGRLRAHEKVGLALASPEFQWS